MNDPRLPQSRHQPVVDQSHVAEARRAAAQIAADVGMDEEAAGALAIVVTEAATNLLKHAGGGDILLSALAYLDPTGESKNTGVRVLSLDKGPGLQNLERSLADGFSTAGTPGTGLGAIKRLSNAFEVYSRQGQGLSMFADVPSSRAVAEPQFKPGAPLLGAVNAAIAGERVCGDSWAVITRNGRTAALVVDGVGHGSLAAEAAELAVRTFRDLADRTAGQIITGLHNALRPTRGAAAAVAIIQHGRNTMTYAGIGNIWGTLVAGDAARHLVSLNGTLGHAAKAVNEFAYPWTRDTLLVMASDGVSTRWNLNAYPQLARKHPALVAGVVYRDFGRGRDDATVLALREPLA